MSSCSQLFLLAIFLDLYYRIEIMQNTLDSADTLDDKQKKMS